jgi:hypothetical protein
MTYIDTAAHLKEEKTPYTLGDEFVDYLTHLQSEADEKSGYKQYVDTCILPHDAIYLVRVMQVRGFAQLVETLVSKSGKNLTEVMRSLEKAHADNVFRDSYPYVTKQIGLLIERYQ